ncbi:expressed unknown protein [Seminavis robusta]|uniref:Uncharacterized protein n=1 Tax=Seminavis robusta TaxID=568900 RepID=A0A9N8E3Z9_9STRA|nr:expressed unknown protein [Seminavis robusta]|eukprot:Sro638_g179530.1 n/a (651) ;mRNA; r:8449-10401
MTRRSSGGRASSSPISGVLNSLLVLNNKKPRQSSQTATTTSSRMITANLQRSKRTQFAASTDNSSNQDDSLQNYNIHHNGSESKSENLPEESSNNKSTTISDSPLPIVSNPTTLISAVANTKASISTTTATKNKSNNHHHKDQNNNNNNKQPYNKDAKNSQEIIRTIHLRNFHRHLEQVKKLDLATNQHKTTTTVLDTARIMAASGVYAGVVALVASSTPPSSTSSLVWTISQQMVLPHVSAARTALIWMVQSLATPALVAVTLSLAASSMQQSWESALQMQQQQLVRTQVVLQIKALARALYQVLDECIQRIPSQQQQQQQRSNTKNDNSRFPRPHPMLVSRSNNGNDTTKNKSATLQSSAKQCDDILAAAKCLAFIGYAATHHSAADVVSQTLFSEKDQADPIRFSINKLDATWERIRQVTTRFQKTCCRDLPTPSHWEERIFALETNVGILQQQQQLATSSSSSTRSWRSSLPILWMAMYPWVMMARAPALAVVWSAMVYSTVVIKSGGGGGIRKQEHNNNSHEDASAWGRQVLDVVQEQMAMPASTVATTTAPSPSSTGTSNTLAKTVTSLSRRNDAMANGKSSKKPIDKTPFLIRNGTSPIITKAATTSAAEEQGEVDDKDSLLQNIVTDDDHGVKQEGPTKDQD